MIEPIKMKPQNSTSFKGMNAMQDPLNARSAYRSVIDDNKKTLHSERQKLREFQDPQGGKLLDINA